VHPYSLRAFPRCEVDNMKGAQHEGSQRGPKENKTNYLVLFQ